MDKLLRLGLGLALGLASCVNNDIVLTLSTQTGEVAAVTVDATIDGRPLKSLLIRQSLQRLVLHLPDGTEGQLNLMVASLDTRGCKTATGETRIDYQLGRLQPTNVTVSLARASPPLCPLTLTRSGVAGRVVSTPRGLDCDQSQCVGYVPESGMVTLTAVSTPAESFVRGVWSGDCSGFLGCTFAHFGPSAVSAELAWNPCSQPQCWTLSAPLDQYSHPRSGLHQIWGSGPQDIWGIYSSAGSFLYHFDGTSWSLEENSPLVNFFYRVWGTSKADVWLVGEKGMIYHFDGTSWSLDATSSRLTAQTLRGVWGSSSQDAWTVGDGGVILHYQRGAGWFKNAPDQVTTRQLINVWGTAANDVWSVGEQLLHYDGTRWSVHPDSARFFGTGVLGYGLWGSSASDVWATTSTAIIHYDGTRWSEVPAAARVCPLGASNIWGSGPSQVFIAGGGQICYFDGTHWSQDALSAGSKYNRFYDIWGSGTAGVWVAGDWVWRYLPN